MNTTAQLAIFGLGSSELFFTILTMVILPLAIVAGIILLVRHLTRPQPTHSPNVSVAEQDARAAALRNKKKLQIAGGLIAATILALGIIGAAWIARQKSPADTSIVIVAKYDWSEVQANGRLLGGTPTEIDGRLALKIENTNAAPLQVSILRMDEPPLSGTNYWLSGEVKYADVRGDGYLEMWNHFKPPEPGFPPGQYFSRTLDYSGPLARLTGTSDWRPFSLPFYSDEKSGPPTRLEFNLFLPGKGVVYIAPIQLMERAPRRASPSAL